MKVYPVSIEVHDVHSTGQQSANYLLVKMSCGCESEFCVVVGASSSGEANGQFASKVTITDRVSMKKCQREDAAMPHEEEPARTNLLVLQAVVTKALTVPPLV